LLALVTVELRVCDESEQLECCCLPSFIAAVSIFSQWVGGKWRTLQRQGSCYISQDS